MGHHVSMRAPVRYCVHPLPNVRLAKGHFEWEMHAAPEGWWVTPRKVEVPREKPWLWRRTAMISSSRLMLSRHSVSSAYLRAPCTHLSLQMELCWVPGTCAGHAGAKVLAL